VSCQDGIIVITENAGTACTSLGARQGLFIQTKRNVFGSIHVPRGIAGLAGALLGMECQWGGGDWGV
jgi:hypothetical protein